MSDEHQKPHHQWTGMRSPSNGTNFLRSNLFIFLLGQIATATIGLAVFLIAYGTQQEQSRQMAKEIGELKGITSRMDDKGTNFSHYGITAEMSRMDRIEARLSINEEQVKKIDVMNEKITRIDKTVEEIRNNTRK
jgi:hypothetical protein